MEIIFNPEYLENHLDRNGPNMVGVGSGPLLIDRFLDDVIEIDADALYDGQKLYLTGVMGHIEEAGIHSGDSACVLPPPTLSLAIINQIRRATGAIAAGVGTVGLINIQLAIAAGALYITEANPRTSHTVPFVAKATGVTLVKAASLVMCGQNIAQLREQGISPPGDFADWHTCPNIAVKEAVLPFKRFRTLSGNMIGTVLGLEIRSTGEAMSIGSSLPVAFAKTQRVTVGVTPRSGTIVVMMVDSDKYMITMPCFRLHQLGYKLVTTGGTASVLERSGIPVTAVSKDFRENTHFTTFVKSDKVAMVVGTPERSKSVRETGYRIRTAAATANKQVITTVRALQVAMQELDFLQQNQEIAVKCLQDRQAEIENTHKADFSGKIAQ